MNEKRMESCQIKGNGILFNSERSESLKFKLVSISPDAIRIKLNHKGLFPGLVHTEFALDGGLFQIRFKTEASMKEVPENKDEALLLFENMPEDEKHFLEEVISDTCESIQH